MAEPLFIATECFDPSDGEKWGKYLAWANIPSLTELAGLDGSLCRHLMRELSPEDWHHRVKADFRLDYLLNLAKYEKRRNILGLYRNPEAHIPEAPGAGDFRFMGYDLIEEKTQISALTNCGGFPDVFHNEELNSYGLIGTFDRASEVRRILAEKHPRDAHTQCEMYAIWRLNETD